MWVYVVATGGRFLCLVDGRVVSHYLWLAASSGPDGWTRLFRIAVPLRRSRFLKAATFAV